MPKISVVMPAYNAEKYIGESIESILNQTFTDFEFIIIDDGSTDRTAEIIKSYNDKRIKYVKNEINSGIVFSLNRGLDLAQGKYIARMDADDIAMKERFDKQLNYMEHNSCIAVVGSNINMFGEDIETKTFLFDTDCRIAKANLIFNSCLAHPTALIRKSILDDNNLKYNPDFNGFEDYELWWRIAKVSEISVLDDILLNYRIHKMQITQTYSQKDLNKGRMFLKNRLHDLGLELSEQEEELFSKYCINDFAGADINLSLKFLEIMTKIVDNNSKSKFFNDKAIRYVCYGAASNVVNSALVSDKERNNLRKALLKSNLSTPKNKIKFVINKIVGR